MRALSALGVLKHFEQNSISFNCIAGTSMGAIVGALYSYYQSAETVEKKFREFYESKVFADLKQDFNNNLRAMDVLSSERGIKERLTAYYSRLKFFKRIYTEPYLIPREKIYNFVTELIPDVEIQKLPVDFCCVSTNLVEGKKRVARRGSLREAILSTTAVPGIMPPFETDDLILSDGGSVSMTPVEELKEMGADFSVAIEVFPDLPRRDSFDSGMEILERCSRITSHELHKRQLKGADVVISPGVKDIIWSDFKKFDYAIAAGEIAAFGTEKIIK